MDYLSIHDNIINRAKNRIYSEGYESHHILPKCEGGSQKSAAEFYNVVPGTITYRVKSDSWKEWFYINGGEINYE